MTDLPPGAHQAGAKPSIRSEVGQLRTVVLHRPGIEVERITPTNMDQLLFDELLWVEHAQQEHDAFADLLRGEGVEVLYIGRLLADVVADPEVARSVVERHVTARDCGPHAVERVRRLLLDSPPQRLAEFLIGGVSVQDLAEGPDGGRPGGLVTTVARPADMLLQPLPNLVFARDSSTWIGEGVTLAPMNRLVRRREADLMRTIYAHHPRFAGAPIWFGGEGSEYYPATFEGGDLLVVGERGIAIGMSERTTAAGIEALATALFAADVVDRILVADLPKVRAAMHLDTIVTQVDVDAFITYPTMTANMETYALTPGADGGLDVTAQGDFVRGLAWAAGLDHARAIEPAFGSIRAEREQWNDANNTLAVRPGVVVAYERNVATNEILDAAGISVRTIPSYELPRGRGGPRCMSCPVRRDPV